MLFGTPICPTAGLVSLPTEDGQIVCVAGVFSFRAGNGKETPAKIAMKSVLPRQKVGLNSYWSISLTEIIVFCT